MNKWDRIEIKRKMAAEELDQRIKKLEMSLKVLKRLHFTKKQVYWRFSGSCSLKIGCYQKSGVHMAEKIE